MVVVDDALLIQFTSLDTKDLEREFKVFLDLSQHEYKGKCSQRACPTRGHLSEWASDACPS